MGRRLLSEKIKSLLPYFLLISASLVVYKAINELSSIIGVISQIWGIITPFIYGFLLAYILNIPCGGIQRLLAKTRIKFFDKSKRAISIIFVYIIFLLLIALVLNWIIPIISNSMVIFIANFSIYYENALTFIERVSDHELFGTHLDIDEIMSAIGDAFQNFDAARLLTPISALVDVGSAVFTGFIAFISSIYILFEKEKFKEFIRRMLRVFTSSEVNNVILHYSDSINKNFKQYILTQTIDGLILGTIATIALYLLGSPFFLVLGIMLGIVNYIPYFGSIFGSAIAAIVVAFTQGITMGLLTAGVLLIIQQIDGNFIQPKLMSGSFSFSPFLVIISVTVGGAVGGIFGMIAAIPIVAVLKDILENIITHFEKKKFGESDTTDNT